MPRNTEVIRQWKLLRTLEASRHGETVAGLARQCGVTQRTVWRDVAALQEAGFPLVDEKPDGRTRWKLLANGLKGLQNSSLSISELASLYFSRALAQYLVGTPFQEDARTAMDKVAAALPPRMRAFLDQLPGALNVKATPLKKREESRYRKHIAALLSAVLEHRQVKMQYYRHRANRRRITWSTRIGSFTRRAGCTSSLRCPSTVRFERLQSSALSHCR